MTNDALSPNHYQFPGGHELRHITAHLTSFGGQAVQYVGRATRLDERANKHAHLEGRIEDLNKAINFIQWEIERIQALFSDVASSAEAVDQQKTNLRLTGVQVEAAQPGTMIVNAAAPAPMPPMTGEKPVLDKVELTFTLGSLMDVEEAADFLGMTHEKFIAYAAESYARDLIASEFYQSVSSVKAKAAA